MAAPENRSYTAIVATTVDEPWLGDALSSIRDQDLPAKRTIVVVNGPGASEAALAEDLMLGDAVQVVALPTPSQAGAFAHGIALATTPYVAFLDADDLWVPSKQMKQIALLNSSPHVDAVSGLTVNFTTQAPAVSRPQEARAARAFGATTFRRTAFTAFGLPDSTAPHFAWTYRWWLTASNRGITVTSDDEIVLERRVHTRNSWVVDRARGKQQLLTELRRTIDARRSEP